MKKFINPTAILYILILIAVVILIGFISGDSNNQTKIMKEQTTTVVLETSLGNIEISLLTDEAPETVANFLKLAKSGFYDNTKFHRVIKSFMIQGGDPYSKGEDKSVYGTGGPGYTIPDESNSEKMVRGVLAMANTGQPNSGGSQFFITTVETPWLQGKHTIFGKVIAGMEVVDKIENSKTDARDLPVTPVIVLKVTIK
jgi:cyclophilin family peptidyl-prolyl cis-trans isomerase